MGKVKVEVEKVLELEVSKSEKMRQLYDLGLNVSDISKILESHYSFVYGVIDRYSDGNIRKVERVTKSDIIRKKYDEGLTIGEISKEMNTNYSYVFSVVKKYRESK